MLKALGPADIAALAMRLVAHPCCGPDVDMDEIARRLLDDHYGRRGAETLQYVPHIVAAAKRLPRPPDSEIAMP